MILEYNNFLRYNSFPVLFPGLEQDHCCHCLFVHVDVAVVGDMTRRQSHVVKTDYIYTNTCCTLCTNEMVSNDNSAT